MTDIPSNPLVSILIPTYNRTEKLLVRSLPSAMAQTYTNIEILVIGDGTEQETVDAMAQIDDPRVFFTNLPRPNYPRNPRALWQVGGTYPLNWGLDNCKGEWVLMLGDDDMLYVESIEILLEEALSSNADYVYGVSDFIVIHEGIIYQSVLGQWPPVEGRVDPVGLWKTSLNYRYDTESWRKNIPCDWDLWSRMLKDGVVFKFVPKIVYRHIPEIPEWAKVKGVIPYEPAS